MASHRNVFFSFHYDRDAWRAAQVRGSAILPSIDMVGKIRDGVAWESVKRQSDPAIRQWIRDQLQGTSVTVVLIGQETASRKWVLEEIAQSAARGNGLLGVRIHDIVSYVGQQRTVDFAGPDPFARVAHPRPAWSGQTLQGIPIYNWLPDGRTNLATWIEQAAIVAGR